MTKKMTIAQLKQLLIEDKLTDNQINELRKDERKGVQTLLRSFQKIKQEKALQQELYEKKLQFDTQYKLTNRTFIAGVDEAGRGPLAGPVVAAAVVLNEEIPFIGLNDSKQLSESERDRLYEYIIEHAISYHVSIVHADEIDRINIFEATKKSMYDALVHLIPYPEIALIDAVDIAVPNMKTISVIKGDQKSLAIAAASIVAKVTRDRLMKEIDQHYPMYDFAQNKGYGTKKHLEALKQFGPSPFHRRSFSPVKELSS